MDAGVQQWIVKDVSGVFGCIRPFLIRYTESERHTFWKILHFSNIIAAFFTS